MPQLKAVLANIGEVDEKYRDLYTQKGDKWEFTGVEGVKTQADIDRLNTALTKERTDHAKTKSDLNAAKEGVTAWEGLDVEDVKAKLEKLETYETGNKVPELAKNFEATVQARVQQVLDGKVKAETTKLQRQLDEVNRKNQELTGQVTEYTGRENTRTVHDAIRAEAVKAKVLPDAMSDVLLIAGQELKLVDGKVLTEDGRDPSQVIEDFKKTRPYYWPQAQGAGGQGSGQGGGLDGDNPFKRDNWNQTKISQLVAKDSTRAAKLAEAAGVPKDATGNFKWHVMPPKAA
jgi:hypothetical protein